MLILLLSDEILTDTNVVLTDINCIFVEITN